MNEVAKYYTLLTPFLKKWDETTNQDDFTYLAVMGTLMEAAKTAETAKEPLNKLPFEMRGGIL